MQKQIVDQYGQAFKVAETLAEPQTARLAQLQLEVANHPSRGLTPQRLNDILQEAEMGNLIAQHELFADMEERDGHLFAELSKRKRAVTKLDWDVVAPRNASAAEADLTAFVKELLQDMPDFEDMLFDLLDGVSHGFSCLEMEWQLVEKTWLPKQLHHRPQSWFQMDRATRTKIHLRDNTAEGAALNPFGWLVHQHKAISGYTSRSGLGRVLVWPYLFKHYSVGDLAEFIDIYGLPMRVGKYPANATADEKLTLMRAVAGIGHNAAGIMPATMSIDFEQAVQGTEAPFEAMISWAERSISKAIIGGTLTSESGSSGLGSGLAEIHNEVRMDIRDSDCKQLAGTITTQLIYPLLALNKGFADARRCPRFFLDTQEAEDLKQFADSLPKLVGIGVSIPENWVHDKLRIPVPSEKDRILAVPAAPAPVIDQPDNTKPGRTKASALVAALTRNLAAGQFADQDAVDGALELLDGELQVEAEKWLKPALAALKKAESGEAALEMLASDNPLVADSVLIAALTRAMFVVELLGADAALLELK
ncbi:MAG: DUF935 domain-containing protein [Burkholderiaceae bacterium]|nr:DUF935 domain-containing protein [Burkholderiaceae bacterium]